MAVEREGRDGLTRRAFLEAAAGLGFSALIAQVVPGFALGGDGGDDSPLDRRVGRDWEKVYRDLFRYDSTFHFLCAPNDTHNCLLTAYVRNGVVVRIGPSYGYGKATDLDGNRASARWDPRCCQKGLALTRRFYGDRRVRGPMVRKGFLEWVRKGFPRDEATGLPPREYFKRAEEPFVKVAWEEAADVVARSLVDIAKTYSGEEGARRLHAQHYDEASIEAMQGAGVRTMKFRGGMPLIGISRLLAHYRMANSMALLDAKVRGVPREKALGGTGFDNYSWHTDLPPGHPMVTGQQTVEFDLSAVEHCDLLLVWGMNWITTKMPDSHWLTEARTKGTKVVVIACEYGATSSKGDEALVVRPGTTPALALGFCHVILREKLEDEAFVRRFTDLPLLVRMDTLEVLRARDVFKGHAEQPLSFTKFVKPDDPTPPPGKQVEQIIPESMRPLFGDCVVWDRKRGGPVAVSREQVGDRFDALSIDPALEGEVDVPLAGGDGKTVKARTVYDLVKRYVMDSFSPEATEALTWAPAAAVESLARDIAKARGKTLFAIGMGPNQFFNNDLKDRAIFLLAALTGNVGRVGGNVGSFAGNYRVALLNGFPQWTNEDPFDLELDPAKPARVKQYWRAESAHYYNHDDHPLRVGKKLFTGKTHLNCPTKTLWVANANSILGNVKWHYHVVQNVLPRMEMIAVNEWWWTPTCEWADVVFGVDSWAEMKHPDLTASVTNPFLQPYPRTPLPRIFDTVGDIEVAAHVARALARATDEPRFADLFKFVGENKVEVYLQRILDASGAARGYRMEDLEARAKQGIPALLNNRTYPKAVGWEQTEESKPWWTRTGRLEFYRDEPEFKSHGEGLPIYREPIDSTFYEPNAIVSAPHPCVVPDGPEAFGIDPKDLSCEPRQVRNVVRTWRELLKTEHPLAKDGYKFIFHTPKYRHGAHTTPIDTDQVAHLFGPFGDIYRRDKRSPFAGEGYVDIHPDDARGLGVEDGDYVWIDSDPEDRPFRGWKGHPFYKVARLLCRARYYPGTPRGVTRMWFNMYGATPGSVQGAAERPDGLAKNPRTSYQAMFRSGSHQSGTRGWLRPTLMTDSLVRKELVGQRIGQGFLPDVHCPTGAPRESIVKITRAEPGGIGGKGLWRPAALGYRPRYENEAFRRYLEGGFVGSKEA